MPADLQVMREIADGACVDPSARIGAFCTIGPNVHIGAGTILRSHVTVLGHTTIGRDNVVEQGSVLGASPQDLKYAGRPTYLVVGDRNYFGPRVTAHVGTESGGYVTRIGHENVIEAGAHVAHDCFVDDRARLGPQVMLAGHIRVESGAVIDEMVGVHHFSTIGQYSRTGPRTPVRRDVPPFTRFTSHEYYTTAPAVEGVHAAGLAAAGLSTAEAAEVRDAIRRLFEEDQALAVKVAAMLGSAGLSPAVRLLCEFCRHSLSGRFGRYRELFRRKIPPEAVPHLPPALWAEVADRVFTPPTGA